MTNEVVWIIQASSAAGVMRRPSVPVRVWWYFVSPTRVVAYPVRESDCVPPRHVDYGQCVRSGRLQKGWVGEFGDGFLKTSRQRVTENGKSSMRV
jgi:hypothetical protein